MQIIIDDLSSGEVLTLLEEHLKDMYATSPPECVHALDVEALKANNITFFSAWINNSLAGCVAIKRLSTTQAELKSMRTTQSCRGTGIASSLLTYIITFAKQNNYTSLSLETGTQDYFIPARTLYKKFGFVDCGPFSEYELNPNSHFMTLKLQPPLN